MKAPKGWPAGFLSKLFMTLIGLALPLAMAAYSIPKLVLGLGESVFGLFALVMALLGYSSVLDLGLGRAVTKMVAECSVTPDTSALPYVRAASYVALAFSSFVALLLVAIAYLAGEHLGIRGMDAKLVRLALLYAAPGVVFVTLSGVSRGILEGVGDFSTVAMLRLLGGIATFLAPVYCVASGFGVEACVASVVIGRVFMLAWGAFRCRRVLSRDGASVSFRQALSRLWSFGGWVTVSNIVSPLMTYMDRFLLGAMLSTAAVAVYVTPYDMMVQMVILPSALSSVLFPHMSRMVAARSKELGLVYQKSLLAVFAIMAALVLCVAIPAPILIGWWVNPEFAAKAAPVARALALGVLCNGMAQIPFSLLHSAHRARTTAMFHLIEFVPYLLALVLLVKEFGVAGAAMAWSLRCAFDLCLLLGAARPVVRDISNTPSGLVVS